jgi:hypothetical protein
VVDTVFETLPSSNWSNWTNTASTYDEYRILAWQIEYSPFGRYHTNVSPNIVAPIMIACDRTDATAAASMASIVGHVSVRMFNLADSWKYTIRADGLKDFQWTPCSAPVATFYCKTYADNVSASYACGRFLLSMRLQLRSTE